MSSKDVIIADIYNEIKTKRKSAITRNFLHYHFQGIKSLHGIKCTMQIEIAFHLNPSEPEHCRMLLRITHPDMCDDDGEDHLFSKILGQYENLSKENISLMLDALLELLPTLQFNLFNGNFYPSTSNPVQLAIKDFFKDVKGLQFRGDECCVCLELVNTKTECKHYLCIPCYQQLKFVNDERPCPKCREDISYTA